MAQNNTALVPVGFGATAESMKNALAALDPNFAASAKGELSSGVRSSFGVMSFKGKVFAVKFGGEKRQVLREKNNPTDPDEAASFLDVVIVQGSPHIAKTYYKDKFREGDDSPPTCFSLDGVKPDDASTVKQCSTCALCPWNVWGSAINEQGSKIKACADSRRIALVPFKDVTNEAFGGPMMLRIPPASLGNLAKYGQALDGVGFPAHAVVTRIGFDMDAAFPLLVFSATGALDPDRFKKVMDMRDSDQVKQILFDRTVEFDAAPKPTQDEGAVSALAGAANPAAETVAAPTPTAPVESEADARKRKLREEMAALEAEEAAEAARVAAAPTAPVESDEDRELREMEELLAAKRAARAGGTPTVDPAVAAAEAKAKADAEEAERKAAAKAAAKLKRDEEKAAKAKAEAEEAERKAAAEAAAATQAPVASTAEDERAARKRKLMEEMAALDGAPAPTAAAAPVAATTPPAQVAGVSATAAPAPVANVATADTAAELDDLLNGLT